MAKTVYVFNCFNEPVTAMSVAGYAVGDVSPWSEGGEGKPLKYTPNGLAVKRSKYPTKEYFAIGENSLLVPWDSFTGSTTVKIPDPSSSGISLDDDLILFACTNEALLLTTRGFVVDQFPMVHKLSEKSKGEGSDA